MSALEIQGLTRSAFLARSALAAGGLYGAGAVAPIVRRALAQTGGGDAAVLGFALTLERIEAAFYKEALKTRGLSADVKKALEEIAAHENAHVEQISSTLDALEAPAPKAPTVRTPGRLDERSVLSLAVRLEDTGVGAYNGAAPLIQSSDVLIAAGSIVHVEARHAGVLRELAGNKPAPAPFDRALSEDEVRSAVEPFAKGAL